MIEVCDDLIKQTTAVSSSTEKILNDIVEFSNRLSSSLNELLEKCSCEIDSYKNNRNSCEFL